MFDNFNRQPRLNVVLPQKAAVRTCWQDILHENNDNKTKELEHVQFINHDHVSPTTIHGKFRFNFIATY